jgi:hypothetical protein
VTRRRVEDLDHEELATLAKEYLLGGQLIDRSGMPVVIPRGREVMRDIAIDEWMGASPIYTKRTQRLLGFEAATVEACFKAMQLDIGAPPEFMDFRYSVVDDALGHFHLDHCGALIDVEPMGEDYVVAMCHHIEDPTFDATGWAIHPQLRMRPIHRPPRTPADRHPHCAWEVVIDPSAEPSPEPTPLRRIRATNAANLALHEIAVSEGPADGMLDYSGPLNPDLQLRDFATPVLHALREEICLQGQLLAISYIAAVEDRFGTEAAVEAGSKQFTGVAGVVAERLRTALGLGTSADDLATILDLHPGLRPRSYVDLRVEVDGDNVLIELADGPAVDERGIESWATLLAAGHDRALGAIAVAVDPHWAVRSVGPRSWIAELSEVAAKEFDEVAVTKFSTAANFRFTR